MTDLQIKCFLEVAKCLSFTKAAKKIFISQSNISRQIASLEEEWHVPLFDRNTKGVKLTPQGELLAEALTGIMDEYEVALQRARNITKKYSTTISIGCQEHIKTNSYISQMLFGFRELYPDVKIIKERCLQDRLVEGLLNDYFDVVFISDHDIKTMNNLDKLTLFYARVGLVLHKNHPLYNKADVTLADFKDSPFIRYKPMEMEDSQDYMLSICRECGFEPNIAVTAEDFNQFLFSIEMGEGAAIILEEEEAIANSNLRIIPISEDVSQGYLPMQLTRKDRNHSKVLDDLYDYAKKFSQLHPIKDF